MEEQPHKFFKNYLISTIISFSIGLGLFFLIWFAFGRGPINASSYCALILLGIGGLAFVANEGFFDVFSYGFKQAFTSIFGKKANEYNDFVGYKEQNRTKREKSPKYYLSILISGAVFLLLWVVLKIVFSL